MVRHYCQNCLNCMTWHIVEFYWFYMKAYFCFTAFYLHSIPSSTTPCCMDIVYIVLYMISSLHHTVQLWTLLSLFSHHVCTHTNFPIHEDYAINGLFRLHGVRLMILHVLWLSSCFPEQDSINLICSCSFWRWLW